MSTLPRVLPQEVNVSPDALCNLFDQLNRPKLGLHALMVIREGKVAAEGYWAPYSRSKPHTLFSASKTITGLAVGFAVQDGLLSTEDRVVSFFPDLLPAKTGEYMERMTVENLLTMTTGFAADPHDFNWPRDTDVLATGPHCYYDGIETHEVNWVKNFFDHYVAFPPGSGFVYCTHASYMLSVIVQRVTGRTALDYLEEKLFAPLGISGVTWQKCPQGYNVGGWGIMMGLEDLAKIGLLYLNKGNWNGEQLIDRAWIDRSTQVQCPLGPQHRQGSNSKCAGYGYQLWIDSREGAYAARGAFGQGFLVLPQQNTVVAWFSGASQNLSPEILQTIWDVLVPSLQIGLPATETGEKELEAKLGSLVIALPQGTPSRTSSEARGVSGKRYTLAPNALGFTSISLKFGDTDSLTLGYMGEEFTVPVGYGKWLPGKTVVKTEDTDTDISIVFHSVSCAGAWDGDRYHLALCFDETSYINTMELRFSENTVVISHSRNCSFMRSTETTLMGISGGPL